MATATDVKRADTHESIKPLIDLCKAGKLFEVQEWIAAGNPVNPPPLPEKGQRKKTPLEVAIINGFHSLVHVLLDAGAVIEPLGWNSPMSKALEMRRYDLVKLLVEHGFDPKSVDMKGVFECWDPEVMEYFINRDAEVEIGNPLAYALCCRIRTALRILKRYSVQFPSFQEQANIALRHHCKEGNMKWVSLMLWAGADPYAKGEAEWETEIDDEGNGLSALGFAALYDHYEVFALKQIPLRPEEPELQHVMSYACNKNGMPLVKHLLEIGVSPNDQKNGGSSAIHHAVTSMGWSFSRYAWERETGIDDLRSRETMKAIHLLAKNGARWIPRDRSQLNSVRQSLVKLVPDYTVEFIWIMQKYNACSVETIRQLIRTPKMKSHIRKHQSRIHEIIVDWESR